MCQIEYSQNALKEVIRNEWTNSTSHQGTKSRRNDRSHTCSQTFCENGKNASDQIGDCTVEKYGWVNNLFAFTTTAFSLVLVVLVIALLLFILLFILQPNNHLTTVVRLCNPTNHKICLFKQEESDVVNKACTHTSPEHRLGSVCTRHTSVFAKSGLTNTYPSTCMKEHQV